MKLLNEIIDLLSREQGSLNEALLKTKVLLHRIGQQQLVEWVNDELNGYGDGKPIPDYRRVYAHVCGQVANARLIYASQPLPTAQFAEDVRRSLEETRMNQAIGVLEKFAEGTGTLQHPIPVEFNHLFNQALGGGFTVNRAWSEIDVSQVRQIVVEVRSRLLDFALNLQCEIGDDVPDEDVKKAAAAIDAPGLFSHAIFGDNATIVVGSRNKQQVTNVVVNGDFDALAKRLKENGVAEEDVAELKEAIDADKEAPELKEKRFGPRVKTWMQKMLGKAVEASWQIELGVAGGLLTEALKAYYFT